MRRVRLRDYRKGQAGNSEYSKGVDDYEMIMQSRAYPGWNALRSQLEDSGLSQNEIKEAEISFYKGIEVLSHLFFLNYETKARFRRRKNLSF